MAGKKGIRHRRYTAEQAAFLAGCIPGRSPAEAAAVFNARFGLDLTANHVKAFSGNRRIPNGRDCRLKPGQTAWNKGLQGVNGFSATRFKPGNRPQTWRPVGSERVNKDGLIEIKIAEPRTWRPKQRAVWEAQNGPLPAGHVVIFADRNPRNFAPENLIAVSRRELAILNKRGLITPHAEATRSGTLIARLLLKVCERSGKGKQEQSS